MRLTVITAMAIMATSTAFAQDEPARRMATEVAARVPFEKATKGMPYSAETLIESSQALADGNRISQKTTGRVYRDSEGRTRREDDRKDGSTAISLVDPVAGFSYSLDPLNKIAWRTPVGVGGAIMGKLEPARAEAEKRLLVERTARTAATNDAQPKAAQVEREKVEVARAAGGGGGRGGAAADGGGGVRMIARSGGPGVAPTVTTERKVLEGLPVDGRKTTTVIPAGQIGNEQPLTITNEEWRSADLNVLVMTRHTDPRTGESSYRLVNIVRAEPDASLFTVPADYTVKDTGIRKILESSMRK